MVDEVGIGSMTPRRIPSQAVAWAMQMQCNAIQLLLVSLISHEASTNRSQHVVVPMLLASSIASLPLRFVHGRL